MSEEKQIKSTDWLTRGYSAEELARMKAEAIKEAEAELREKQIEEMARVLCGMASSCDKCMFKKTNCYEHKEAEEIYNAGYRKQSKIVRCKDCEYAYMDGDRAYCTNIQTPWYNDYFEVVTEANDFCSYAKMKGGE